MKVLSLLLSICFCVPTLDIMKRAIKYSDFINDEDGCSFLNSERGELIYAENGNGARPKICLWKKNNNMFLILRGSTTLEDWIDNFNAKPVFDEDMNAYFHKGFLAQAKAVWSVVEDYIERHNGVVYFTGHSRAASIVEIIHVYGKTMLEKKNKPKNKINFQTIAFAPPPAMSLEGEVEKCSPNITLFVHGGDIFPHLFIRKMSDDLINKTNNLCALMAFVSPDNIQCKAWMNSVEEIKRIKADTISDSKKFHDFRYIGGNKYWLRYDSPPPSAPSDSFQNQQRIKKNTLAECKTTAKELESAFADLAGLLGMEAFQDHLANNYAEYLSRLRIRARGEGSSGSSDL